MTAQLEQLQQLYDAYIQEAMTAEAQKKFGDGLFGFGNKPANLPFHEKFVLDVRALLADWVPESAEALQELLTWVFHMADGRDQVPSIYWTLVAAQSAVIPLIPRLAPQQAETLYEAYKRNTRSWNRLPVQSDILKLLDKARKARK